MICFRPQRRGTMLWPQGKRSSLPFGSYRLTGDAHGVSDATVCRSVKKVVDAINECLFDQTIRWPEGHRLHRIAQDFHVIHDIRPVPKRAGIIRLINKAQLTISRYYTTAAYEHMPTAAIMRVMLSCHLKLSALTTCGRSVSISQH